MEKSLLYTSIIGNALVLQNVVDLTAICQELKDEGVAEAVLKQSIARMSPYLTSNYKRFGEYIVDLKPPSQIPVQARGAGVF